MDVRPKITLEKYSWTSDGGISVCGFTWLNGEYISGEGFRRLISQHSASVENIKKFLTQLNGQFSIVVKKDSEVWLVCSHTWSYPLFYFQNGNEIAVSDDPYLLVKEFSTPEIDSFSKNYFLLFGVTPNNNTLVKQIYQVNPGEIVVFENGRVTNMSFFDVVGDILDRKVEEEKLHQSILSLFERYSDFFKNKQVLLPLTGGYDSRLLACLLKEFGHKNVLCATWGRKGNVEVEPAEKVAKQLGYSHVFIEYNEDVISGFSKTQQFLNYAEFAGHISSMPFLQDYFAIGYLQKNKMITTKTIAMPGYSGDFFAGSHLDSYVRTANNRYLFSKMINKYSSSYPLNISQLRDIGGYIGECFLENKAAEPWQKYEQWDFQERQCKFISNANHAWFYFGVEVLMPLFDKDFIDLFRNLPFEQKLGVGFYNKTLEKLFFKPHKVDFHLKNSMRPTSTPSNLKRLVLKISPAFLKNMYYPLLDDIFYREITTDLKSSGKTYSYKRPLKPNAYNSFIIQWYLQFLDQLMTNR
ncbi:hypothetical protein GM418_17140 [Maribellus comscasis]|uniref:asparagine synthase (glutamine-hydrolyzing) n=1 Tax=Maribellus comscasis TaxID=2681766 RepID=A0A6I6JQW7_9BACT|nr:asparagine synthase C-terminal domain-containing protein [Maribellus comscasis]QGY45336.1 hypothetical protein GM418_17140 [Maribellus comscasis]